MANGLPTVLHRRSSVTDKAPAASGITHGELYINYAANKEHLYIKNSQNEVISFSSDSQIASQIAAKGLPDVTSGDNLKVLQVIDGEWDVVVPMVVYSGSTTPPSELGQDGDIYLQTTDALRAPDVIYQTDGTTGLLGHNANTLDGHWQLEDLDLSSYKYLRCYFAAGTATGDSRTPAIIVEIPLDTAAIGPTGYLGSGLVSMPFNRNRQYFASCAVDSTKTKFQVVHQNTIWDVTTSDANNSGRYCYKIEGWY